METENTKRFTIIAVYKEDPQRFDRTVSNCLDQMQEEDELVLLLSLIHI